MSDTVKRPDRGHARYGATGAASKTNKINFAVHRTTPVLCPVCGKRAKRRSRQQRYCSRTCMRRANYARKAGSGELWGHDSARRRNRNKSQSKNNGLQRPKTGSSISCNGPINILGGGSWRWPGTASLDRKTLANIIWSEIGGEVVVAPDIEGEVVDQ